ncbi:MAG: hypothetical protein WA705_23040 [Candidatus Ozemobacteraceae bacterium]
MAEHICHALTHPQKRIWYMEKLHPGTDMANNAFIARLPGQVDTHLLGQAIQKTCNQ